MKQCKKCSQQKNESEFYIHRNICKSCLRQKQKEYRQGHKQQTQQLWKNYYQVHKKQRQQSNANYNKEHREQINQNEKLYYQKHKKQVKQYSKDYYQTNKGKVSSMKRNAKRERNLGFELLFDNPFKCSVDYHHISDAFVVAIPRDIHRANLGDNHRRKLKPIVEKLYNISYIIKEMK